MDISAISVVELNHQLWLALQPIEVSTAQGWSGVDAFDINTGDHLCSFETIEDATHDLLLRPLM